MPIGCNDRVFMCDTREYGTVSRTGILGFKMSDSYVVTCDSGRNVMYTGSIAKHVVCGKTSKNDCGSTFLLPLDLKTIGSSVMKDSGLSPLDRSKIYAKFSGLTDEDHQKYRDDYSMVSSNTAKTKSFILDVCRRLS